MSEETDKVVGLKLYMLMLAMLLTGSANTILMKVQDGTDAAAPNSGYPEPVPFNQPYVQAGVMFVGELMCLAFYGLKLYIQSRNKTEKSISQEEVDLLGTPGAVGKKIAKTNINPALLAIPAACDTCGSTLMNVALTMCPASIYQMIRGIIVVITAFMAMIFLKRKQYIHHYTSLALIFLGVFLVGLSSIVDSSDEESDTTNIGFGIMLLLIAQCFVGTQFIVEEKLLGDYVLDPLKVVGLEGMWGLSYSLIICPVFQCINCTNPQLCPYGKLSYTTMAFEQYGTNHILILLSVCILFSISGFNGFGVSVTKYASAAQRSTIDTTRTLVVWVFFMCMPSDSQFKEYFSWLQLLGFIILVIGTLIYNEILVVPFWGFNVNTKEAIKKREAEENASKAQQKFEEGEDPSTSFDKINKTHD